MGSPGTNRGAGCLPVTASAGTPSRGLSVNSGPSVQQGRLWGKVVRGAAVVRLFPGSSPPLSPMAAVSAGGQE